ncbi:MAG: RagB/SusD family nutrient uptake outer membrane protein [Bacteroidota bacterium]|nr:RagB/SusD family nutrient uptake outer membrane protein [Bacteroidota bacterium]MDP4211076.1 RagB/SusD family nutrient uptake outer membrane protein [Bacteroidota bacterium]MDP4249189.1 RagB/SusD family nutrient uptake outer membrane protein [Bacteroidota bacterium]
MKHIKISLIVISMLAFGISGCKRTLDQPVLGFYSPSNFFTTDANAQFAVNAAYAPLMFTSGTDNPLWVTGDVASDDAIKGGNTGDQADFESINQFNILPTNSAVEALWGKNYDGVFKCNVVLDGLTNNSVVSESVRKSSIAQAKFLRAYYYFVLTTSYGNIPLHLKVETPEELQSPAKPQDSIYLQIEQDCNDAIADLPDPSAAVPVGQVTKGSAYALLAKVYLFHADLANHYQLAAQAAQAVEGFSYYALTNLYTDNFNDATKNNTEAVFTVNHLSGGQPNDLNTFFTPRDDGGYGFFYPTQDLVNQYEKATTGEVDPRLDYTVGREGVPYYDLGWDPSWTTTGYLCKKWVQPLSVIPQNNRGQGDLNYEVIRYSEILLIEAEALNESGQSAAALIPLNKVRKRARESYLYDQSLTGYGTVPDGLLPDITTTDQSQLRDAIRQERRVELALEFHRFYDIIRYGENYANTVLKAVSPNFNYSVNKWFPIPQSERDTNKKLGL